MRFKLRTILILPVSLFCCFFAFRSVGACSLNDSSHSNSTNSTDNIGSLDYVVQRYELEIPKDHALVQAPYHVDTLLFQLNEAASILDLLSSYSGNEQLSSRSELKKYKILDNSHQRRDKALSEKIKEMLEAGADPDGSYFDGSTTLIFALINRFVECANVLLDHNANVNCMNYSCESPLLLACEIGDFSLIARLLGLGADPLLSSKFKLNPNYIFLPDGLKYYFPMEFPVIQKLVVENDLEGQKRLLEHVKQNKFIVAYRLGFFDIIGTHFRDDSKIEGCAYLRQFVLNFGILSLRKMDHVLVASVLDGNISILKAMQAKKNDFFIEAKTKRFSFKPFSIDTDISEFTLLESACFSGKAEIVELLVNNESVVTQLAVELALKRGYFEIFDFFIENELFEITSSTETIFHAAIISGNIDRVESLMKKVGFKYSEKAYKIAIECGHLSIIQRIKTEEEVNTMRESVPVSSKHKHKTSFASLFYNSANTNTNSMDEDIELAVRHGHLEVLKYFLKVGNGNGNGKIISSKLPGIAAVNGHFEMVKYFENAHGMKPSLSDLKNTKNIDILKLFPQIFDSSLSALNLNSISSSGDFGLIKAVLKKKSMFGWCNFTSKDLDIIVKNGYFDVFELFIESGVQMSPEIMNTAIQSGHLQIVWRLLEILDIKDVAYIFKHMQLSARLGRVEIFKTFLMFIQKALPSQLEFAVSFVQSIVSTCGNFEMIQILQLFDSRGLQSNYSFDAARLGYLDILMCLREHNFPFNIYCMEQAMHCSNNLHIVEYLKSIENTPMIEQNEDN